MSPYWGSGFFEFFQIFFSRLFSGEIQNLASDEIQIGVLALAAISCALIGPFLVLKKMAMFANSLSHTILLGIAGAFLIMGGGTLFDLSHLVVGALIASLLTALLTEGLVKTFRLTEDSGIGLVFTFLFALGIVLVTLFIRDVHLGLESVMGNADALQPSDLRISAILAAVNAAFVFFFFRHFQMAAFDRDLAKCLGLPGSVFHFLLLLLVSFTCVSAFRAIGVLLVLAFLIGPYLTARLFCHRLKRLLLYSCLIGLAAVFCGVALSRHILSVFDLPVSTGGIVVCLIGAFYFIGFFIQRYLFPWRLKSAILARKIR